jgi:quinohemoprotein ethanol dehydrogenase
LINLLRTARSKTAIFGLMGAVFLSASACKAGDTGGEWAQYGRTSYEQRFSPLNSINRTTVARLAPTWFYEFDTDRGQEATALVIDGVLYVSTAWSKVYAFDAQNGKLLWSYDPAVPRQTLFVACCDAVNRGVAVSGGRVFVGTLDGRLIAIDAKSGKMIWSVVTVDQSKPYTSTGAPHVVKGKVLIGNGGAEYGVRGYLSAYDVSNGKLAWRFYTVPNPEGRPDGQPSDGVLQSKAAATWFGDGWRKFGGGGGTVWDSMAYDPDADLLYFGVGNGGPWDYLTRSNGQGDNLFLSSIIAVRPGTGEYVWHYQTTPGDAWDFTATQQITLADLSIEGRQRKVLMQAPKNGFFYVLDRLSGKLLSATAYVPQNWAKGVDLASGRPDVVAEAHYETKPWLQSPSTLGGHSWHPMAFSPQTGLMYIPAQIQSTAFKRDEKFVYQPGRLNLGLDFANQEYPEDPAIVRQIEAGTYGELIGWDPAAQRARWTVKHRYFVNGGVLATAGGLVFQGTAEGTFDAYDGDNGKLLWSYPTVNGIVAPPVSYAINGKQFVAVMVGYGGFAPLLAVSVPDRPRLPGRLMVFALDGAAKPTPLAIPVPPVPDLHGASSAADPASGLNKFNTNCEACHGVNASGRFTADLRRSPILLSQDVWRSVVIGGIFAQKGMVSFAKVLTPQDAEDIRAYVLSKARRLAAKPAP